MKKMALTGQTASSSEALRSPASIPESKTWLASRRLYALREWLLDGISDWSMRREIRQLEDKANSLSDQWFHLCRSEDTDRKIRAIAANQMWDFTRICGKICRGYIILDKLENVTEWRKKKIDAHYARALAFFNMGSRPSALKEMRMVIGDFGNLIRTYGMIADTRSSNAKSPEEIASAVETLGKKYAQQLLLVDELRQLGMPKEALENLADALETCSKALALCKLAPVPGGHLWFDKGDAVHIQIIEIRKQNAENLETNDIERALAAYKSLEEAYLAYYGFVKVHAPQREHYAQELTKLAAEAGEKAEELSRRVGGV